MPARRFLLETPQSVVKFGTTMRLALDGREVTRNQPGGLRSYTESVIGSLVRHAPELDLVVYTDRQTPAGCGQQNRDVFRPCPPTQMFIREQFSLPRRLALDHIDLCHFPANTAPARCPVPYVLTLHDTFCMERGFMDIALRGTLRNKGLSLYAKLMPYFAARRAKMVITVSQYSKARICKLTGVLEERVAVIPQALHPRYHRVDATHLRQQITSSLGVSRLVLVIGSAEPRKNVPRMLSAFAKASAQREGLGLVLIWKSRAGLNAWLRVNGISLPERTHVVADVTDSDLVGLYSAVDALLFVSEAEGFGLPVVEAMACGCPVVTSNATCLPDTAGDAALLADPYDEEDIARQVQSAVFDENTTHRLVSAGYERAASMDYADMGRSLMAVYAEATGA